MQNQLNMGYGIAMKENYENMLLFCSSKSNMRAILCIPVYDAKKRSGYR